MPKQASDALSGARTGESPGPGLKTIRLHIHQELFADLKMFENLSIAVCIWQKGTPTRFGGTHGTLQNSGS